VTDVAALLLFAFVSTVTPGPNNVVLWASGMRFGVRATLPHVAGSALGVGALVALSAAGVAAVLSAIPGSDLVLRVVGTTYLVYLAYRVAGSGAPGEGQAPQPLTLGQAVVFQFLNPKAYLFALAAVSTYRPGGLQVVVGSALVVVVIMLVVLPSATLWAAGGRLLAPLFASPARHRALTVLLALLLAVTIALIWV
jgi:threonine/homoserine/homoserine lactone efflux protein